LASNIAISTARKMFEERNRCERRGIDVFATGRYDFIILYFETQTRDFNYFVELHGAEVEEVWSVGLCSC
jgi:hypothetical protein